MSQPSREPPDPTGEPAAPEPQDKRDPARAWEQFYAYCLDIIGQSPAVKRLSGPDREDCIQDVMTEIVRHFGTLRPETILEDHAGWIRVLSRNKAIDIVRRRLRHPEILFDDGVGASLARPDDPENPGNLKSSEAISLVWEVLLSLDQKVPVTSYLVFYLRTIEEYEVAEIAELFSLTQDQVRSRCHRVRKMVQSIIERKQHGD